MTVRFRLVGGILGALCIILAGCSNDAPAPRALRSSGSTDAVDSPTPPKSPSSAGPRTPTAFIRHWVVVKNKMFDSGNTDNFRALSQRCIGCNQLADEIDKIYRDGGYVRSRGWDVVSLELLKRVSHGTVFDLVVDSAPQVYKTSRNGSVMRYPGDASQRWRIQVRMQGAGYSVGRFGSTQ